MSRTFSPKQLARAIGVSESSMKRWVDQGRVRMTRTRGGHRRIPLEEGIRLIREHDVTLVDPGALGMGDLAEGLAVADAPDEALYEALRNEQAARARGIILAAYLQGVSLEHLFDDLIAPAMHRIGQLWEHGQEGISIEHHATDTCFHAVNQLRTLLPAVGGEAPVAIGGAPVDDPYILPSMMVATVLNSLEFNTINLGPSTPVDILADAAERHSAKVVWVSISACRQTTKLADELHGCADRLGKSGARLVVGGRAIPASLRRDDRYLDIVPSMVELGAFARGVRTTMDSRH